MIDSLPLSPFQPVGPDAAGVLSWAHLGDLHMTLEGEQNHHDLRAIVAELEACFAGSLSFVFLPGDIADDGSHTAYAVVRRTLDALTIPWCAIVGDHDVHEKSFANFRECMSRETHYAFTVGAVHFVAMNAFEIPDPGSFAVLPDQLLWCERQLAAASVAGQQKVLFLHCYPSELKVGAEALAELIRRYDVRLADMGHTHYNEVANDGQTLYCSTRSTGQREEGPVGFSVVNFDGDAVSWKFLELGALPAVIITSPADVRLLPDSELDRKSALPGAERSISVRAKIWTRSPLKKVWANAGGPDVELNRIANTEVWQGVVPLGSSSQEEGSLRVWAEDSSGAVGEDVIRAAFAPRTQQPRRLARDRDNALGAWPEHGLLGTQLGPNKNGRKW